eukprot:3585006-Prymnesium_polylepis.1
MVMAIGDTKARPKGATEKKLVCKHIILFVQHDRLYPTVPPLCIRGVPVLVWRWCGIKKSVNRG